MVDFIEWANTEKTALYVRAPRTISEQDVKDILNRIILLTKSVDYPIDLIIDRRNTVNIPRRMLTAMRKIVISQQYRRIVFVGFSTLPKLIVETLTNLPSMLSFEPLFADTFEEACTLLGITLSHASESAGD